ncbi:MAG TPA: hypothetical protein DCY88_22810 [Cyanobacteria bacterium UBA11372]|nr:hypothetical protein [Cyanobacteria bacterium UBA11372]
MAKIEATVPERLRGLLEELAADTGQTLSALIADCLEIGANKKVEARNNVYTWRKAKAEWDERQESNQEEMD